MEESEKLILAKQYSLQANAMKTINGIQVISEFKDFRLQVVEGLYRPESTEDLDVSDGINYLMSKGRAVVYELIDFKGNVAVEKTFNLAIYWKDNLNFDKMILDYDNYNPDNSLSAQIILVMPEVIPPWSVTYNNKIETRYNNVNQVNGELLEVLPTTNVDEST